MPRNFTHKKRTFIYFFTVLIFLIVSLCPPPVFSQGQEFLRLRTTAQGTVAQPKHTTVGGTIPQYYIGAGDKLEIFVWQNPDLSRDINVRPDGKLSYPLIGTIQAAGLTIDQLQDVLRERLSQYIRSPEITVSIKETAGNKIIVLGEVNFPGVYTFAGTLSVIEAIAMSGDFNQSAKRDSVIVVSDNFTEHPKVRRLNLLKAIKDGTSSAEMLLQPNDLVYVPRAAISDFNKFLENIAPTINTLVSAFQMGVIGSNFGKEYEYWFKNKK
ncbi:MAG: polysaccharide export protein [Candidatus Omnitrophica bacterium]|nr:polysaccharide export protein [Candidatus Omnitrophota bacterium]